MSESRVFRTPGIIHFGTGACEKIGFEAKRMGLECVLLITDSFLNSSRTISPVFNSLKDSGITVIVSDIVNNEPTLEHVETCLAFYKKNNCNAVIGCGGGSPIDVAKAVATLATNTGKLQDYMGIDKVPNPCPPIFAIPTTAGTGSEATSTTIITDTKNSIKMLIISPYLMPTMAFVDPLLTLGMPKKITAATGLDALTHAIEAYVSRKAQPISDMYAINAMKLIYNNLPIAWSEPQNQDARSKTFLGALQAGIAFSNASVALVHGMSRPIGALFHVPHGVSNAALLGVVTHFSLEGAWERYADIAEIFGVPRQEDIKAMAKAGADKVTELVKQLEIPTLTELGINKEKLDEVVQKMAEDALASGSPSNNPRLATREEILSLYYAAL